jgi:hypothetical protein
MEFVEYLTNYFLLKNYPEAGREIPLYASVVNGLRKYINILNTGTRQEIINSNNVIIYL